MNVHTDHLGSTSYLTKSTGSKLAGSDARYQPFGSYRTTPSQTITDTGFTGQKENRELGLIYMNARYYDPTLARFISPDTLIPNPTNPQQFNHYTYGLNSPLKFVDPSGHRACTDQQATAGDETCDQNTTNSTNNGTAHLPENEGCPGVAWCQSIRPPLNLQDWEMQLIAMVAYFETTGAPEQRHLVIWTILNRLNSPAFSNSVEELLVGTQYHVSLRNLNADGIYQNGIFAPYKDPNRVGVLSGQALANAAFAYYSNDPRYSDLGEALIGVQNEIDTFNNGGPDPTNGAVYFAHGSTLAWQQTTIANLNAQAEIDGLSNQLAITTQVNHYNDHSVYIVLNNIYDPPFTRYPYSGGYCTTQAVALCQVYLKD